MKMQVFFALAPTYFVVRNRVSASIVIIAAVATYIGVRNYRRQVTVTATFRRNIVICGLIGVCGVIGWMFEELTAILAPAPVIYLLEVCFLVCPPVGLLACFVRRRAICGRFVMRMSGTVNDSTPSVMTSHPDEGGQVGQP